MVVTFYFDLAANCKDCVDSSRKPPVTLSEETAVYW